MAGRLRVREATAVSLFLSLASGSLAWDACFKNGVQIHCDSGCCAADACCLHHDDNISAGVIVGIVVSVSVVFSLLLIVCMVCMSKKMKKNQGTVVLRRELVVSHITNSGQAGGVAGARPPEHTGYDQNTASPPPYSPPLSQILSQLPKPDLTPYGYRTPDI